MRKIVVTVFFSLFCMVLIFFIASDVSVGEESAKMLAASIGPSSMPSAGFSSDWNIEIKTTDEKVFLSDEDIALIALVTMAEAEGECEEGKRLVIDTIFNRMDSEHFPDSAYDVIYQPGQFSSMWNGRIDRCEVREDICRLVREKAGCRTNREVIFFTAGKYGSYGKPLFQVGNHYFAGYE